MGRVWGWGYRCTQQRWRVNLPAMTRNAQPNASPFSKVRGNQKVYTKEVGMKKIKGKRKRDVRGGQIKRREARGKRSVPSWATPHLLATPLQLPASASICPPSHPAQQLPPVFRAWMSLCTSCPQVHGREEQVQRVPSSQVVKKAEPREDEVVTLSRTGQVLSSWVTWSDDAFKRSSWMLGRKWIGRGKSGRCLLMVVVTIVMMVIQLIGWALIMCLPCTTPSIPSQWTQLSLLHPPKKYHCQLLRSSEEQTKVQEE